MNNENLLKNCLLHDKEKKYFYIFIITFDQNSQTEGYTCWHDNLAW